jgi:hypothetical protein
MVNVAGSPPIVYKNTFDTLIKIAKYEGAKGLQKGLTPAIFREGSKNFFRIVSISSLYHVYFRLIDLYIF